MELLESVEVLGVATVISVYLVWWITSKLDKRLDKMTKFIEDIGKTLAALVERVK